MMAALPAAAQDYAREKRWADEVVPGLVVGDAVWLETSAGRKFLAIHAPAGEAPGARWSSCTASACTRTTA